MARIVVPGGGIGGISQLYELRKVLKGHELVLKARARPATRRQS